MTPALELGGASAPMLAWVRAALAPLAADGRAAQERRAVVTHDDATTADVQAAAGGDGEAYARIIRRYQDLLARRMHRFSRDARVVEELVHDVFVEAYFSLGSYRGDAPLEHWLQRIATRVGYRYWNEQRRNPTTPLPAADIPAGGGGAGEAAERDAVDEVATALGKLAPRDRLVLTLLYLESRTVAEAADLAGWSQTMVKVQAHRARKRLRKLLEAATDG